MSICKKNILIIVDNLGVGGTQEHVLNFIKLFDEFNVTIISLFGDSFYEKHIKNAGGEILFLCNVKGSALKKLFFLPYVFFKFYFISKIPVAKAHWINIRLPLSLALFGFFKLYRHTNHHFNIDAHVKQLNFYEKFIFKLYLNKFNSVSIQKDMLDDYKFLKINPSSISLELAFVSIRDAINPIKYNYKYNLLFIARLIPQKGLVDSIRIIKSYNEKFEEKIYLHVFGDGPDYNNATRMCIDLNLDYIKFYGYVENLGDYYSNSNGLIKTAYGEPANSVVRESLLLGKLVFSTIESVTDKNLEQKDLLVEINRNDTEYSIKKIHYYLNNYDDERKKYISTNSNYLYGNDLVKKFYIDLIEARH